MFIETAVKKVSKKGVDKGKGSLEVTGQLGDVMKESSHIAYTFAKVRNLVTVVCCVFENDAFTKELSI